MIKRYRNLPMQKKMMLTFLAPLLAIELLLCVLLVPQLSARYHAQILQSLDLSCNQAASFINAYMDTMPSTQTIRVLSKIRTVPRVSAFFRGSPGVWRNWNRLIHSIVPAFMFPMISPIPETGDTFTLSPICRRFMIRTNFRQSSIRDCPPIGSVPRH